MNCKCRGAGCFRCLCDKCDRPNDRAAYASYCTPCGSEFQARIARDPEQRPIGTPDPRRAAARSEK